ncbi:MAG: DNA polymerase III subunit delta [Verrucomicrobia bacterium]|nr:MAG: DNA polymerase III subunit delta [Verrucomicrobiota bacterium]
MPLPCSKKSIYFVTGSDEAAVKSAASNLADSLVSHSHPFAREIISGTAENVEQAVECILSTIQALLTFPFFQATKLVWLKNVSILTDSVIGRSEAVGSAWEKLQSLLEKGLPENIIFLLSAPEADKRRTFYKAISKLAEVKVCDKPRFGWNATDADISDWLGKKAEQHGLKFTASALDLLTIRIGADTRQAELEFEKLSIALSSQKTDTFITEGLVRELVPTTRESDIFDLSNALLTRNTSHCLESLQQLFFQGERAIGILLAAIIPTLRNLLIVKDLIEPHAPLSLSHAGAFANWLARLPSESVAHLPKKKDGTVSAYVLGRAAMNCARYSLPELKSALSKCLETNRLLISSTLDERIVLTRLLVWITR